MKLNLFLGIMCFFVAGMLTLAAISAFMQGQLSLGLIGFGVMISNVFLGYIDLKAWKEGR